ncbi:MAG: hypothetical protein DRP78_02090 [Candidatus Omnitrophota bacterium]|nr:MAG: hypothetical protein DRP78_02090 [Candidatus Omnitrophota bacterium]
MAYDQSLDECLFAKSYESELYRLTVSIYSYNKGVKKLQISRNTKDAQGEYKFAKLGRMNKEEVESILPLIQEAMKVMD